MNIKGMDKLEKQLIEIAKAKGLAKGIQKATLRVENSAKDLSPVDTGFNRASINSNVFETYGEVVAGTEYAMSLEFGTHKMVAQPFMYPALEMNRKAIVEDIKEALRKEMF